MSKHLHPRTARLIARLVNEAPHQRLEDLLRAVNKPSRTRKLTRKTVLKYAKIAGWLGQTGRTALYRQKLEQDAVAAFLSWRSGDPRFTGYEVGHTIPVRGHPIRVLQDRGLMRMRQPHFFAFIGSPINLDQPDWLAIAMDDWIDAPGEQRLVHADAVRLDRIDKCLGKRLEDNAFDLSGSSKTWLRDLPRPEQDARSCRNPPLDALVEWLDLAFRSASDTARESSDLFKWADEITTEVQRLWEIEILPHLIRRRQQLLQKYTQGFLKSSPVKVGA